MDALTSTRIERKVRILEEEKEREKVKLKNFDQIISQLGNERSWEVNTLNKCREQIKSVRERTKCSAQTVKQINSIFELLKRRSRALKELDTRISSTLEDRSSVVTELIKRHKIIEMLREHNEKLKLSASEGKNRALFEEALELHTAKSFAKDDSLTAGGNDNTTCQNSLASEPVNESLSVNGDRSFNEIPTVDPYTITLSSTLEGLALSNQPQHPSDRGDRKNNAQPQADSLSLKRSLAKYSEIITRITAQDSLGRKAVTLELCSPTGSPSTLIINEVAPKVVSVEILTDTLRDRERLLRERREIIAALSNSGIAVKNFVIKEGKNE